MDSPAWTITLFLATWMPLVGVPVGGAAVVWFRRRDRIALRFLAACESVVVVVVVCWKTGVDTPSPPVDVLFCIAAVLAGCILYFATYTLEPPAAGVVAGALAGIALLPCFTMGLILGLVSLADDLAPPARSVEIGPGVSCRVTWWGMSFGDRGYIVHLHRYWPPFPVVRREVVQVSVDETNVPYGAKSASCESVAAASGY